MTRPALVAGGLLAVALAAGGCGLGEDREPLLSAGPVEGRGDAVFIEFSGCEPSPRVEVVETDEAIRIGLDTPDTECEPLIHQVVGLDAPLGDRVVVDDGTGDVLFPE